MNRKHKLLGNNKNVGLSTAHIAKAAPSNRVKVSKLDLITIALVNQLALEKNEELVGSELYLKEMKFHLRKIMDFLTPHIERQFEVVFNMNADKAIRNMRDIETWVDIIRHMNVNQIALILEIANAYNFQPEALLLTLADIKAEHDRNERWVELTSEELLPTEDRLYRVANGKRVHNSPISRETLFTWYKSGKVTHYWVERLSKLTAPI